MTIMQSTPENIEQLVQDANNKNSWKTRLEALNVLRQYDCQQSRDVITRLALHDKVFKVKEEALRASQALKLTKGGKPIFLGKKDIGYKASDFTKLFVNIRSETKMTVLDLDLFKETFKILNPEMLDVMSYEKNDKLDTWITNLYKSLPAIK